MSDCLINLLLLPAGGAPTDFLSKPPNPQKAIAGSNVTFLWRYKVADADKPNFEGLTWIVTPSSKPRALVDISTSGVPDLNVAPPGYKGRVMWNGDLSKFVASFVLLNVSSGDEKEYGIEIKFGPVVKLIDYLDLEVLSKYCTMLCLTNSVGNSMHFTCISKLSI